MPSLTKSCLICEDHWWEKQWIRGLLNRLSTKILPCGWSAGVRPCTHCKCYEHSSSSWSTHQTFFRPTGNVATNCLVLITGSSVSYSRIRSSSSILGYAPPVPVYERPSTFVDPQQPMLLLRSVPGGDILQQRLVGLASFGLGKFRLTARTLPLARTYVKSYPPARETSNVTWLRTHGSYLLDKLKQSLFHR